MPKVWRSNHIIRLASDAIGFFFCFSLFFFLSCFLPFFFLLSSGEILRNRCCWFWKILRISNFVVFTDLNQIRDEDLTIDKI